MIDAVVEALTKYFQQPDNEINLQHYVWPPRNPVDAATTIQERLNMSECFHAAAGQAQAQIEIARQFVVEWGGINALHQKVLAVYALEDEARTVCRGLPGIASWSKVLALKNPARFMIYDARVAFALDYIIYQYDRSHASGDPGPIAGYFRQPPTRNTTINEANVRRRNRNIQWRVHRAVRGKLLYPAYLETIHRVAQRMSANPIHIEMMLFARAPAMAAAAFPAPHV